MASFRRTLIKSLSGFAGGFGSGGYAGGITGAIAAGATGGKAKPLKSAAIGAGSGFVGGTIAQRLGYQGGITRVGPYSFRPLSSRFLASISPGGPVKSAGSSKKVVKKSVSDKAVTIPRFGRAPSLNVPTIPVPVSIAGLPGGGVPVDNTGAGGPVLAGAMSGPNTTIMPIVLLAGGALLLAQSS